MSLHISVQRHGSSWSASINTPIANPMTFACLEAIG